MSFRLSEETDAIEAPVSYVIMSNDEYFKMSDYKNAKILDKSVIMQNTHGYIFKNPEKYISELQRFEKLG